MSSFVTFGSLNDGDYFFARGKFHCKETIGLFQKPPDLVERTYNAFYYDGPVGRWTVFDELTLVQTYDECVHGLSADIIRLRDRQRL